MVFKNLDGILPGAGSADEDKTLLAQVDNACSELSREFDRFAFAAGLESWMNAVFACNAYVDATAPWALKKTDPARMIAIEGPPRAVEPWDSTISAGNRSTSIHPTRSPGVRIRVRSIILRSCRTFPGQSWA